MRAKIIIALVALGLGLFGGAKLMEHLGREYIVNNSFQSHRALSTIKMSM